MEHDRRNNPDFDKQQLQLTPMQNFLFGVVLAVFSFMFAIAVFNFLF